MSDTLPRFASIGSLIIDDIIFSDGRKEQDILGGGGVFAIYGMRIWQPKEKSRNVGYIIHKGFDYPKGIDEQISKLDLSLVSIYHSDKHTTRGLNTFSENEHRDFEYIHPIIRSTTSDFPDAWIESIQILHLISSPERVHEIIDQWRERETQLQIKKRTQFLWEPLPWSCLPENLKNIYTASDKVDIITPNHEELADMQGFKFSDVLIQHNNDFKQAVEYCGRNFLKRGFITCKTLIVRASKYGAMVISTSDLSVIRWIPAYWNWKTDGQHVIDVTGAGNAFCGGFTVGWIETDGDAVEAARYGAVSASYAVEQMGVPVYSLKNCKNEQWNFGPSPKERLDILKKSKCIFK